MVHVVATLVLVVVLVLVGAGPARASCAALSDAEQRGLADVVFEGVALDGKTETGTLVSPARFRVDRYLKGAGPEVVQVTTAYEPSGPFGLLGTSLASTVGITSRPGELNDTRLRRRGLTSWKPKMSGRDALLGRRRAWARPRAGR